MGSMENKNSKERKGKKEKKEKKEKSEKKEENLIKDVVVEDVTMKDEGEVEVTKEKKEKKDKKEKKSKSIDKEEKKEKKPKKESTPEATSESTTESPGKKRKREAETDEELAIDLSLPTPPSKKQLRKLKKHGEVPRTESTDIPAAADAPATEAKPAPTPGPNASQSRGDFGVWIGNLRFSTSADTLKNWLLRDPSPLTEGDITRINMPMNKVGARGNKGYAYVDFKSAKGLAYALSLSESELDTRRVLIKDSKDYGGRPKKEVEGEKSKTEVKATMKPPTKILYVGNLPFDVTDDEIREHFAFAGGNLLRVRTARFQDSGKCKGFSFLDFDSEETVKRCLSGVAPGEELDNVEGKAGVKLEKTIKDRKSIGGKRLKMEFGEAPDVRYKKRFGGKDRVPREGEVVVGDNSGEEAFARRKAMSAADAVMGVMPERVSKSYAGRERKVDARNIKPGAALASAPRLTGGIVESQGKKMKFDD